eukprot:15213695-Alexandrium_andersonii.AAC.1
MCIRDRSRPGDLPHLVAARAAKSSASVKDMPTTSPWIGGSPKDDEEVAPASRSDAQCSLSK